MWCPLKYEISILNMYDVCDLRNDAAIFISNGQRYRFDSCCCVRHWPNGWMDEWMMCANNNTVCMVNAMRHCNWMRVGFSSIHAVLRASAFISHFEFWFSQSIRGDECCLREWLPSDSNGVSYFHFIFISNVYSLRLIFSDRWNEYTNEIFAIAWII